jgi:hypothetical protein
VFVKSGICSKKALPEDFLSEKTLLTNPEASISFADVNISEMFDFKYKEDIEECYNLWYHNNYQGKFESYEEDLVLLCASLTVSDEKEFNSILKMIQMKPEIKELMEGKIREMNHDEKLVTEYRTWKDENERITASI